MMSSTDAGERTQPLLPGRTPPALDREPDAAYRSDVTTGRNPIIWPRTEPVPTVYGRPTDSRYRAQIAPSRTRSPLPLRIIVSLLALVLVAGVGGLVYQGRHPGWLIGLRQVDRAGPPAAPTVAPRAAGKAALVSSSAKAITYSIAATSYSIAVVTSRPCWIVVTSPAGASPPLFAKTVLPGGSPMAVAVHGSSSVTVAAKAAAITITADGVVLDTIESPVLGTAYTFVPQTSTNL